MARFNLGAAKSADHAEVNRVHRAETQTFGSGNFRSNVGRSGVEIVVDFRPLANALAAIGKDKQRDTIISRGINRGIERFRSEAHRSLKMLTKIRTPTRLKKGVHVDRARVGRLEARYTIRDRNIRITNEYFGAKFSNHHKAGGLARQGKPFSPIGAKWNSWDGARTGKRTFMLATAKPVFIRFKKAGKYPIMPVFGPNPAEMVRTHAPHFAASMRIAAQEYVNKAIVRAYRESEARAKARFGL